MIKHRMRMLRRAKYHQHHEWWICHKIVEAMEFMTQKEAFKELGWDKRSR